MLVFTGFADINDFGKVDGQTIQVGADLVIDLGAAAGGAEDQDVLTLIGVTATDLDQMDFLFA